MPRISYASVRRTEARTESRQPTTGQNNQAIQE